MTGRDWRADFESTVNVLFKEPDYAGGAMVGWQTIDPETLPPDARAAYETLLVARDKRDRLIEELEVAVPEFATASAMARTKARTKAMILLLWQGDLRPLAAAIAEGEALDPSVGETLAGLIDDGRIKAALPRPRGAPKKDQLILRKLAMTLAYQAAYTRLGSSEAAFEKVAGDFVVSDKTVRAAVTQLRPKLQR